MCVCRWFERENVCECEINGMNTYKFSERKCNRNQSEIWNIYTNWNIVDIEKWMVFVFVQPKWIMTELIYGLNESSSLDKRTPTHLFTQIRNDEWMHAILFVDAYMHIGSAHACMCVCFRSELIKILLFALHSLIEHLFENESIGIHSLLAS